MAINLVSTGQCNSNTWLSQATINDRQRYPNSHFNQFIFNNVVVDITRFLPLKLVLRRELN